MKISLFTKPIGELKTEALVIGMYDDLNNFNTNRNTAIHGFLKNKITYEEFKDYCKEGREIQLRLSPFNHSKEDIKSIMQHFEDVSK